MNFPFETNGKLMILGVPILKHFRVFPIFCLLFLWFYIHIHVILRLSGIRRNEEGVLEEEENFDEAIKSVNTALVPTRVG